MVFEICQTIQRVIDARPTTPKRENMELENRYFVVKIADFDRSFTMDTDAGFFEVLDHVLRGREIRGKPPLSGLFIESDWPEYETTKAALVARISGTTETLENIQSEELARSRFNTEKRIGGPGSIPQETLDSWNRDAKEQIEADGIEALKNGLTRQRETIDRIGELFKVMMCSAEVFTDAEGIITGYKIKTGAAHSMLAELMGDGCDVFIPRELPPSPMQHGARCWYAFVKQPEQTNDELATIDRIEREVLRGETASLASGA